MRHPTRQEDIDDWLDNGTINGTYKPACYQAALKHVPEDLRDYTDVTTAISVALQDTLRSGGSSGGGAQGLPSTAGAEAQSGGLGTDGHSTTSPRLTSRTLQHAPGRSIYPRAVDKLGTTSADSVPIPLLVLAGVGTTLLGAAIAVAARKRLRERKTTLGRSP